MDVSKDLIAASATPLILAILQYADSYGYEIIKKIRSASDNELVWTEGMLYPVLHRLGKWVYQSYWKESPEGRRGKYYRLLPEGKGAGAAQAAVGTGVLCIICRHPRHY